MVDEAREEAAIRRLYADNAAALEAGDLDALAALYTEDAIQLPPTAPARVGWEAIRSSLEEELAGLRVEVAIQVMETVIASGWAFARGTYRTAATPRQGGAKTEGRGNWLDVLERQGDGGWKIARSTWTVESD